MPSGWHSAAASLVLALSLALKFAVQDVNVVEDEPAALQALAKSLSAKGYSVVVPRADLPIVQAQLGGCRLTARVLDPHATYRDTELLKLPRGWTVTYVWRGGTGETLPRLGPLVEYYLARELVRTGFAASRAPVIMVSHQSGCALPGAIVSDLRASLERVPPAKS